MIGKIREIVLGFCSGNDWMWDAHVKSVVKYSKLLAVKMKADEEICEVAAWLHDIYQVRECVKKDHHLRSAEEAVDILKGFGYDEEKIERVRQCILTHSAGSEDMPDSIEAKIVMVADALSHFDNFLRLTYIVYNIRGQSFEDGKEWLVAKYKQCIEKVSLIPEARDMVEEKHKAILAVLNG